MVVDVIVKVAVAEVVVKVEVAGFVFGRSRERTVRTVGRCDS